MRFCTNLCVTLLALTLMSGCGFGKIRGLDGPPEGAPPEYRLGWEHGCQSGFTTFSNDFYKKFYTFKQDVKMMKNVIYARAWNDSYAYCRSFINRYLTDGLLWGPGFQGINNNLFDGTADLRGRLPFSQDDGFGNFFHGGMDTPGWGSMAWGADAPCQGDWLGRKPDGCGWMGYE